MAARDIDPNTLLLPADGHCLRDQALDPRTRSAANRAAASDMSAASLETPLRLTAAGCGVALASRLTVENRNAGGDAFATAPLKGEGMTRRVDLVFRRDTTRPPAFDRLAACVRAAAPPYVQKTPSRRAARLRFVDAYRGRDRRSSNENAVAESMGARLASG